MFLHETFFLECLGICFVQKSISIKMKNAAMKTIFSILTLLLLVGKFQPSVASTNKLFIQPSTVTVHGTSTLHDFQCSSKIIEGSVVMDSLDTRIISADITIPVKSIHSESSSMDGNMYDAMDADADSEITFSLLQPSVADTAATDSLLVKGVLTIHGVRQTIEMKIHVDRANKKVEVEGTKDLLMTDFGIKPPTFMFGTLKAGDKVTITFDLHFKAEQNNLPHVTNPG
jgi:polyisoprenoid-binding protein YceI